MPDIPDSLQVTVGTTYELELPGLGTAGYRWDCSVDGDAGLVEISLRRGTPRSQAHAQPVGLSNPETVIIQARKAGQVTLNLRQHRAWETTKAPRRQQAVVLHIKNPDAPARQ